MIEIFEPLSGGLFGPGFRVWVHTDFIGPFPVDHHWDLRIHPIGEENNWKYGDQYFSQTNDAQFNFMTQDVQQFLQPADSDVIPNTEMRLLVRRMEGQTQAESLSIPIVFNFESGLPFYNQQRGIYAQTPAGGGFSDADRQTLNEIWQAVYRIMHVEDAQSGAESQPSQGSEGKLGS